MPKNILVCLDGTWDTAHRELQDDSNVARLYSAAVKDEGQVTHYVAGVSEQRVAELIQRELTKLTLTEAIASRLITWTKLFAFFAALPATILLVTLSVLSINNFNDLKQKFDDEKKKIDDQTHRISTNDDAIKRVTDHVTQSRDQALRTAATAADVAKSYATLQQQLKPIETLQAELTGVANRVTGIAGRVTQIEQLAHCGSDAQWSIKVATDAAASSIDRHETATTISAIRAWTRPSTVTSRVGPYETKTWAVEAMLVSYKHEVDGDYHLVLQDASGATIVAEIPDPACAPDALLTPAITTARRTFEQRIGSRPVTAPFTTAAIAVRVAGVGFFDIVMASAACRPTALSSTR